MHRSVKPAILTCFGDIAAAIGPAFERYNSTCIQILKQATHVINISVSLSSSKYICDL